MTMALWIAIAFFPFIFLVHLWYERLWAKKHPPRSRQKAVARICLLVALVNTLLTVVWGGWLHALYVLIVSLNFAHVYFHIFNMSETARRIRILTSAYAAQKEGSPWQPPQDYTPQAIIEERIKRLETIGAIQKTEDNKWITRFHPLLIATLLIEQYKRLFS